MGSCDAVQAVSILTISGTTATSIPKRNLSSALTVVKDSVSPARSPSTRFSTTRSPRTGVPSVRGVSTSGPTWRPTCRLTQTSNPSSCWRLLTGWRRHLTSRPAPPSSRSTMTGLRRVLRKNLSTWAKRRNLSSRRFSSLPRKSKESPTMRAIT